MRTFFASLLLLAAALSQAQGLTGADNPFATSQSTEFLPVEEAYRLEVEVTDEDSLRLYWQIADSYYLYQHRFVFQIEDAQGPIAVKSQFPEALEREDEYFGLVRVYYNSADIQLDLERAPGANTRLTVSSQGCADAGLCYPPRKEVFDLDASSGEFSAVQPTDPPKLTQSSKAATAASGGLLTMLLLAFIGGSILNLMPCVFPILSLKVLSFARNSNHDRHLHSWMYTAGVIISFVAVAALLIGLQQAGQAVGWGFQLQSTGFVIALVYLFVAMGLSLSGLIEFGGSLMNTGGELADRRGMAGSFFTGVLAVVVASPCTAPFMGTALGFAITQPPLTGLLVFAALGAGMAAPLLLFGYSGAARALMPRPGPWMETLKQFLAFPLYATAIWLLWVVGRQAGVNTMALALAGALMLTLALWLWRLGNWRRGLALACACTAIVLGGWRGMDNNDLATSTLSDGHVAFSRQSLADLRAAGSPVFVDVTADWCITCIANEQSVLLTDEMRAAFKHHGVVYMVADWTNYDADIARFIEEHGRTGIPLYLMYPADPYASPLLLPQLLSDATVLAALEEVSVKNMKVADTIDAVSDKKTPF